jgi:NAD-dependent dihydropyrimidine dehydrogenase PreA subunit
MKCTILLHSATGNTRLVAQFASRRLIEAGHQCILHDIVTDPEPPDCGDVDLLGVACPTNYFGQSRVMQQFLDRLPPGTTPGDSGDPPPRLAFQLGTSGGEPGAHFVTQAEQLQHLGWLTLGARSVSFPDSWPPHRALTKPLSFTASIGKALGAKLSPLRALLSLPYPDMHQPSHRTVSRLGRFIDRVARRAAVRDHLAAQSPADLAKDRPRVLVNLGRSMTLEKIRHATNIRIDAHRCTRCGTCVDLCPSGCLTRANDQSVPRVGTTCVGCWACYQHCPADAISGWHAPAGKGRYPGPDPTTIETFNAKWLD